MKEGAHLFLERDAASGLPRVEYVWLDDLPIAMLRTATDSPGVYFIHSDHLNTPQWVSNPWGSAVWAANYSPFGAANITNATLSFNLRFPGQVFDAETGLRYNWHRYYDPSTGRYLTSDPIGLAGGLNTYAYVSANPLKYVDPEGTYQLCPPGHRGVPAKNYEDQFPKIFDCKPYEGGWSRNRLSGGMSVSASAHALLVGCTVAVNGFASHGQRCASFDACVTWGPGIYAGWAISGSGGVSSRPPSSGWSENHGAFFNGGAGWASNSSLFVNESGLSTGKQGYGEGVGAAGGFISCKTYTTCN